MNVFYNSTWFLYAYKVFHTTFYEKLKNFIAMFCIVVGIVASTENVIFTNRQIQPFVVRGACLRFNYCHKV